jgi:two-component system cell cycle response regulator CtrA
MSQVDSQSTLRTGKLVVDLNFRVVSVDDQPVHLTGTEYRILELLSLRKGTILSKEMFLDHLYGGVDEPELKIIDVFVCKLRKKLAQATGGNHYIETVWGRGYVLRDPAAVEEKIGRGATTERSGSSEAEIDFSPITARRPEGVGSSGNGGPNPCNCKAGWRRYC